MDTGSKGAPMQHWVAWYVHPWMVDLFYLFVLNWIIQLCTCFSCITCQYLVLCQSFSPLSLSSDICYNHLQMWHAVTSLSSWLGVFGGMWMLQRFWFKFISCFLLFNSTCWILIYFSYQLWFFMLISITLFLEGNRTIFH